MNKMMKAALVATLTMGMALVASTASAKKYTSAYRQPASTDGGDFTNEIETNLTTGYLSSEKACKNCDTSSTLDVGASYLHYLQNNIQVGGEGRLRTLSKEASGTGDSETLIDIAGVAVYNFQSDLANAFYAKAGIGFFAMRKDDGTGYENKLGIFAGVGKRFPLFSNVTYTPELRLVKKGDIDIGIEIALLNFSIHW